LYAEGEVVFLTEDEFMLYKNVVDKYEVVVEIETENSKFDSPDSAYFVDCVLALCVSEDFDKREVSSFETTVGATQMNAKITK
jgi:hypothetical protein